jgi:hypothetical protein
MSSPIKDSKLKPKMPKMPLKPKMPILVVDPKPGVFDMRPNPIRNKPGIPNGPTVGKVYKTY